MPTLFLSPTPLLLTKSLIWLYHDVCWNREASCRNHNISSLRYRFNIVEPAVFVKISKNPKDSHHTIYQIFKIFSSMCVSLLSQSLRLVVALSNYAMNSLLQPILMSVPANYLLRAVRRLQFRLFLTVCKQRNIQNNISVDWPSYF